ncbi:MAG: hypothetical protein JSS34_05845 [Proteobacteria bacterium]|nr:hypothetical protein [Pseudomonadota bacterium]
MKFDDNEFFETTRLEAQKGDAQSQYLLAQMFFYGVNAPRNDKEYLK